MEFGRASSPINAGIEKKDDLQSQPSTEKFDAIEARKKLSEFAEIIQQLEIDSRTKPELKDTIKALRQAYSDLDAIIPKVPQIPIVNTPRFS